MGQQRIQVLRDLVSRSLPFNRSRLPRFARTDSTPLAVIVAMTYAARLSMGGRQTMSESSSLYESKQDVHHMDGVTRMCASLEKV
ncbi:hypothetical protein BBBOND_0203940 [Babesia bigemina]|uniref:Uncharacterized protein n=1 Tax=Babesia bigemina TaxID=5866 RepID=A0A061D3C6_BABBI|nr:hypothetical protein BBBOND_0203940 [Babesia bigemina]CDR95236.1 hypothetical protein BBBOND_0203940 [Babesia bigemina]|eukprot:XP_012767422.1 hypothetical protein BBBOND_0203940 [Babesia bigemina]